MFEPFERLGDRATGTGVGLGLAVAKGFLEAMGGTVDAADTAGRRADGPGEPAVARPRSCRGREQPGGRRAVSRRRQ